MTRKLPLLFFLSICLTLSAQRTIRGIVLNTKNVPLEGATVYLNNTTVGTTTDLEGKFTLKIPNGEFELIISYLGYRSMSYPIKSTTVSKPFKFKLRAKNLLLNEIVIPKKLKRSQRRNYLKIFRKNFLGESTFAQKCRIFNEKALKFHYDEETNTLRAFASEPLRISNTYLGYKITYDLIDFRMVDQKVTYSGTARFEELPGVTDQQKEWRRNRKERYLGSSTHFLQTVLNDTMLDEKYIVDNVRLVRNPMYPSDKEIRYARRLLERHRRREKAHYSRDPNHMEEIKKAKDILKRTRLRKYKSEVINTKLDAYDYSQFDGEKTYLEFQDYLKITFYGYPPDVNYNKTKRKNFKYQVSLIKLRNKLAIIENPGILQNPLDIYMEGYWAFKRIGDLLPLNYSPTIN